MEKYKCKLCSRLFNNGRALGGHMKSHLAKLPKHPPKQQQQQEQEEEEEEEELEEDCSSLSTSNTSPEEDVAMSLMMLSRDTWHWVDSAELKQHKCEVCDKVFKSTQALGGHRTSHKKAKRERFVVSTRVVEKKINKKKIHECPICNKVFGSGQALGGHKRSHFLISPIINNNVSSSADFGDDLEDDKSDTIRDNWIDLNMPAPTEDDDEMSAVSVAEFINYC